MNIISMYFEYMSTFISILFLTTDQTWLGSAAYKQLCSFKRFPSYIAKAFKRDWKNSTENFFLGM